MISRIYLVDFSYLNEIAGEPLELRQTETVSERRVDRFDACVRNRADTVRNAMPD